MLSVGMMTPIKLKVRIGDRKEFIALLDRICGKDGWKLSGDEELHRSYWFIPSHAEVVFVGDNAKSNAIHFKLSYVEPPEPKIKFLKPGQLTPYGSGMGKSTLVTSVIFKHILDVQDTTCCVFCDHEAGGTLGADFNEATVASGSIRDPESK